METTNATITSQEAINLNSQIPADHELYTIPSTSAWFEWNGIHEIERAALKEFFDSSSYTRTPKVYREYRDWIVNKFREEPSRRLRFTEVRRALVGDVSLLKKVFVFLEKWGLINFGVDEEKDVGNNWNEKVEVRVEEGAPVGVRVVAVPGSGKGVAEPVSVGSVCAGEFKFPPLVSYSDVFGVLVKQEVVVVCASCGDKCASKNFESKKGKEAICKKCFESRSFREGSTIEDFESDESKEVVWTDEETLSLLQSVVKHGDDWELISQTVKTKSKIDCIAKMITLPLGDFMLGSDHGLNNSGNNSDCNFKDDPTPPSKQDETVKAEDIVNDEASKPTQSSKPDETIKHVDIASEATMLMQNDDVDGPPLNKKCIDRSSIMKQVAVIASMVSQHITGAAAEAAVAALCDENPDIKEVFDIDDEYGIVDCGPATTSVLDAEDSEMKDAQMSSKTCATFQESSAIPLALRYRAATATAIGAAAARAKLLADQEDKELEFLMATIIDNQLKKLQCKTKVLNNVQQIMETECRFMAEQEESIISERLDILKTTLDLGITRLRESPL